ncbi:unnamed protein product [Zymoseptoria tritici ST99CH_3D1]|uniref:Zn(2)-C6 fungal-type domain-containing protein n=2 Tax=Zymoseptoria tritici TaxID=1047171 RepID=A0A1X7RIM0_ZYMT9|nr:unnamed protein product [Zymoseptoria tritici ST99CH_3D7]SMR45587.1 unnamed protein product [Zymoseptoria tritici ST99CH_1E4]SMR46863.1 unnamed protein product [Zymoseptoria tritici ST99CH_3D1]
MASTPSADRKIACNACRHRKTACDRRQPKCGLCVKNYRECEYVTQGRQHPGLRAGYVSRLEKRIDQLESRLVLLESRIDNPASQSGNPATRRTVDSGTPENLYTGASYDETPYSYQDDQPSREASTVTPAAANTTDPFAEPALSELCMIWFQKYHRWFPIMHQPSFMEMVTQRRGAGFLDKDLAVHAIVAMTLFDSKILSLDQQRRGEIQHQLTENILTESMGRKTLDAVQAMLILSVLHYSEGHFMRSWNSLAIARRIAEHLSIGQSLDFDSPSASSPTALRRLSTFTNSAMQDEERLRAYWMIEMLDSLSVIGARHGNARTRSAGNPPLPCSDSLWTLPETVLSASPARPYSSCSAFSLCIIFAVSEVSIVHRFLSKAVDMTDFEQRDQWQAEAQRIDERLTAWRDEFVAAVFRLINAEYAHHERPEMDAQVVLCNCVLNTAVITLLHQRSPCAEGIDQSVEPWAFASSRCVYACENTAFKVRQMDEDELLICHPLLVFSIFVAARFYIVHSKALDANVPTNLHSLAFALHTCGRRWPLARFFEDIIRIAVAEYRTPIVASKVPKEFYDLRLTTFEVAEPLIEWVQGPGAEVVRAVSATQAHGATTFARMEVDVLA